MGDDNTSLQQHQQDEQLLLADTATTTTNNNSTPWTLSFLPSPAVGFGLFSLPCLYKAYSEYHAQLLSPEAMKLLMEESAEEAVKRSAASQIALRALRVSTFASIGVTSAITSFGLAWAGYSSLHGALLDIRGRIQGQTNPSSGPTTSSGEGSSGGGWWELLPTFLGTRSHPDFAATKQMSEKQELQYLAATYFPDEDWTQPDGKAQLQQSKTKGVTGEKA
jgi:hypothetical protein